MVPCGIEAHSSIFLLPFRSAEKLFICYNKVKSYEDFEKELTRKVVRR